MHAPSVNGRLVFGVAVLVALASAAVMAASGRWEPALRFVIVAAIMLLARAGHVPGPFAGAFAVALLLATWASVQHWYRDVPHFDTVVHLLTPGTLAAAAYFVLVHHRLLPDARGGTGGMRSWAPVLWVVLVGTTAAVVWEFYELVLERIAPETMRVGYADTVVDLLAGMIGSLAAGWLMLRWSDRHRDGRPRPRPPTRRKAVIVANSLGAATPTPGAVR